MAALFPSFVRSPPPHPPNPPQFVAAFSSSPFHSYPQGSPLPSFPFLSSICSPVERREREASVAQGSVGHLLLFRQLFLSAPLRASIESTTTVRSGGRRKTATTGFSTAINNKTTPYPPPLGKFWDALFERRRLHKNFPREFNNE